MPPGRDPEPVPEPEPGRAGAEGFARAAAVRFGGSAAPRGRAHRFARLRPVADRRRETLATLFLVVVYLDQLPPAPGRKDARLAAVRRFKRRLFGGDQNPGTIKARAAKLAAGTSEATEEGPGEARGAGGEEFATFEALGKAVEALVVERGFYDSQRAASR